MPLLLTSEKYQKARRARGASKLEELRQLLPGHTLLSAEEAVAYLKKESVAAWRMARKRTDGADYAAYYVMDGRHYFDKLDLDDRKARSGELPWPTSPHFQAATWPEFANAATDWRFAEVERRRADLSPKTHDALWFEYLEAYDGENIEPFIAKADEIAAGIDRRLDRSSNFYRTAVLTAGHCWSIVCYIEKKWRSGFYLDLTSHAAIEAAAPRNLDFIRTALN